MLGGIFGGVGGGGSNCGSSSSSSNGHDGITPAQQRSQGMSLMEEVQAGMYSKE